ncbi:MULTISPECIES: cobyrinate a,c-diamide synthase [Gordonibacter]|uniref:Hydrogenobyrinate a,c-diamide synthase n=1 Tax=Gordonibacter faecis TaxID=3047475 RepID=A0ABT7DM42_9ACTN|nr:MULTISPECIES: cobyrinate a,c-diamide synthase [unclassified Gordonibacter]MDJ1650327.1 cobyrinate a,c-diamide synthase [Gordonibacter sp. KGMB12511]HIW76827.1 cobyrinate a,c-diamide synthase [Candidatus Gordonibacter avicola]
MKSTLSTEVPLRAVPRLMIAAPHGRSGKTVLTLGLLRALANRGVVVQPFKKGPDYLDTGWHSAAARRESRNLDCFFMEPAVMQRVLLEAAEGGRVAGVRGAGSASGAADLCVVEGAMGLFDGLDVEGTSSSAQVAKQLGLPVVLVVDVTRMTRTTAALVQGLAQFDPDVHVAGVLLNRVQGARQERLVREAVEHYCGIPVVGALPKDARMDIPDRHLGLTSNTEAEGVEALLDDIARVVEEHVDLDALRAIAASAEPLEVEEGGAAEAPHACVPEELRVKIAVVRDRVFSFYYPENLQALEDAGAELVFVDSLADTALPDDVCGLYIGGGFPEVFAEELQANASFRASVRAFAEQGFPVYAECGGLMFLARRLRCNGQEYDMAGALDMVVAMEEKRQGHGYAVVVAGEDHPWLPAGTVLKGHEHHHSHVVERGPSVRLVCTNERGHGIAEARDGACYKNVVAAYTHLNALASPTWPPAFVTAAREARATDGGN